MEANEITQDLIYHGRLTRGKIGTFTMITPNYIHMSSGWTAMVQQTFLIFLSKFFKLFLCTCQLAYTYLFIDISVSTENTCTFNLVCSIDKRSIQICSTETVAFSF